MQGQFACGRPVFAKATTWQAQPLAYNSQMKKLFLLSLLTFAIALGLQAQSEPQKSPPLKASPATGVHGLKKSETQATPPMSAPSAKSEEQSTKTSADLNAKPIDPNNMDTSVKPSDDFFHYANGAWIKRTEIPPEYTR